MQSITDSLSLSSKIYIQTEFDEFYITGSTKRKYTHVPKASVRKPEGLEEK